MVSRKISRRDCLEASLALLGCGTFLPITSLTTFADEEISISSPQSMEPIPVSRMNPSIRFRRGRCEECGDCRNFCEKTMTVFNPAREDQCIYCGLCTLICQSQAMTEQFDHPSVSTLLSAPERIKIASISPSVRVSLGEMFGMPAGRNVESAMIDALRSVGFDYVLDACFAADITVMEEGNELVEHLASGTKGPLFTSCCPAWKRFAELFYPEFVPQISKVKSPLMIQGALVKSWFAEQNKIDPAQIVHVTLAPCTAKKYERTLPEMSAASQFLHEGTSIPDVDFSLTTRELGLLLKSKGISHLLGRKSGHFDPMMGAASGAGLIFGSTGGVLEASIRSAFYLVNHKEPPQDLLHWDSIRGFDPIRKATVDLGPQTLRVAAVHGPLAIRSFLDDLKSGKESFDFVEMMICPGGCIGGGGQPRTVASSYQSLCQKRASALYSLDEKETVRLSFQNPEVKELYTSFLNKPGSDRARQLLYLQ